MQVSCLNPANGSAAVPKSMFLALTVSATPTTSFPFSASGNASAWMGVGVMYFLAYSARPSCGCRWNALQAGKSVLSDAKSSTVGLDVPCKLTVERDWVRQGVDIELVYDSL